MSLIAAIRIRGCVGLNPDNRKTLELLRLFKGNHMVLLKEAQKPMLQKVQGYATWGEVNEKTLALALKKRARLSGNRRVTDTVLKEKGFGSFDELAKALIDGKTTLDKAGLKPVLRLSPPKKGHERAGIKKIYSMGGALGYRADDINILIKKMV